MVTYCISLIADGVATLPTGTFLGTGLERKAVPMPAWLRTPNPYMTAYDFWHRVMVGLLMDGNAFIATIRDDSGSVVALYPLDPRAVTIQDRDKGRDVRFIAEGGTFDRSQILWIPGFTVPGHIRGLSPLELARQATGLGLVTEEYGARFFAQGASMTGVIQHPGSPGKDQALMLRDMFRKSHAGVANSHSLGILTGGATWQSVSITPEQSQFLETRRYQKSEIALIYRIPAYQVDPTVSSTWGSGVEEANRFFITQTLSPWLVRIEQAVSTFLLAGNRYMKFNLDARLRAKTSERYAAYAVGSQNGWLSADEIRAMEDMEPIPGDQGNGFYRLSTLVPLDHDPANTSAPEGTSPGLEDTSGTGDTQ